MTLNTQQITKLIAALTLICSAMAPVHAKEPIQPIEPVKNINLAKMELGKKLFFDPRLSKSGFISCNSCHNLSMGGSDNIPTSIGHGWHQGPINAPTVLNSSLNVAQFWDGRAADLAEQAAGPIANPGEMASSHDVAVSVIKTLPQYVTDFGLIYDEKSITIERVADAIAEFEKTLLTPNSPFDQWLRGDKDALNETELAGYELFKSTGCTACHNGPAVGGNSFQKMGVVKPYETQNSALGVYEVSKKEQDKLVFKVPTLRNVELTYPYFHDGAVNTLTEAVDIMARIQLGRTLSEDENGKIVAFLRTLTGDQPQFILPILPPSADTTPRPTPF